MRHDAFKRQPCRVLKIEIWRIYKCDINYTCKTHATCLVHMCDMAHLRVTISCSHAECSNLKHNSFVRVTYLIHTCDMTHSYMRHDSCTSATWFISMSHDLLQPHGMFKFDSNGSTKLCSRKHFDPRRRWSSYESFGWRERLRWLHMCTDLSCKIAL